MINKKVLIISTYPIANPQHGGQKRTREIFDLYKRLFKEVRFTAVYYSKNFQDSGHDDIPIHDPDIIGQLDKEPYIGDLLCGEALIEDKFVKTQIIKLLEEYKPDIIQIEQAYPYAGLKPLLEEIEFNPELILSSHNIEHAMKRDIYKGLGLSDFKVNALVSKIRRLETELSARAKIVIAVRDADRTVHEKMGAKNCVLVPNGSRAIIPTQLATRHWEDYKKKRETTKIILFIGSMHQPNLEGFEKMIGYDLKFLPASAEIWLAGGISNYIQTVHSQAKDKLFWQKAVPLGLLSDDNLWGLISICDLIILPITSGGGSNLKTAEAFLADKKIVTTSYALRTFEKYGELPGVFVANTKELFKTSIIKAVNTPLRTRTHSQNKEVEKLEWSYCLKPLEKVLRKSIKTNQLLSTSLSLRRYVQGAMKRLKSALKDK